MIEPLDSALIRASSLLREPKSVDRIVISGRQRNHAPEFERIDIRLVLLKTGLNWQTVGHDGRKDTTKNTPIDEFSLTRLFSAGYSNLLIETSSEEMSLRVTKSGQAQVSIRKKAIVSDRKLNKDNDELTHDRKKSRLLDESEPIFQELGISDHNGKLKPSKTDKFLQVQEFLKVIESSLPALSLQEAKSRNLRVVDLGCGHAYLTFAAHRFLSKMGFSVEVIGVDERQDSRSRNIKIAESLDIANQIHFSASKISDFAKTNVDVAIALHACDTATDDAIAWAVKSQAELLLIAPCCHHDIQKQIKEAPAPWHVVSRYGILHERVGDLLTDAIRAQILRIIGYKTEVFEFIAGDHTPRNIMIRATRDDSSNTNKLEGSAISNRANESSVRKRDFQDLEQLLSQWKIQPKLLDLLSAEVSKSLHQ